MRRLVCLFLTLIPAVCGLAQRTIRVPGDAPGIQAGIALANVGDTVLVAPGTYNENLDFLGKNITVTSGAKSSAEAQQTVLNATQDGPPVVWFHTGESRAAVLNGFTIQNGHNSAAQCTTYPCTVVAAGVLIEGASPTLTNSIVRQNYGCDVVIRNGAGPSLIANEIVGPERAVSPNAVREGSCYGNGVAITNATKVELVRNNVHDNGPDASITNSTTFNSGVIMSAADEVDLIQNFIHDNGFNQDSGGGEIYSGLYHPNLLVCAGNLVYRTSIGHANTQVDFTGSIDSRSSPPIVRMSGNTFAEQVNFQGSFSEVEIYDNVFSTTYPSVEGIGEPLGSTSFRDPHGFDIQYNDEFSPGVPVITHQLPMGPTNIYKDPLYQDQTNFKYHETANSPTIYAGDINAPLLPATDLDGKNRTVCGKVDMGAYQKHPNPPIALAAAPNPVAGGSPVTFTATLTGNCNIPTGTVTFLDNGTALGTGTLNGVAAATLSTSFLTVGQHSITATYPGDFNFEDSTSNTVSLTVTGLPSTTALTAQPNPARAFQPVTLTAAVTDPFVPVTGTVTFAAGTQVLGTAPLVNGTASITTGQLGAGTYTVTAAFNATTQFAASSASVQLVVNGAPTTTTLQSSLNPSLFGQAVTFRATAAQTGSVLAPDGSITFRDGAAPLATVPLAGGSASFTTSTLAIGSHTITAQYSGSKDADPSTSAALTQVVSPVSVALQLTATPNPAHAGETVTLRLSATASDGRPVNGTATFAEAATRTAFGNAPITNGVATLPVSTLSVGTHTITATYADPANGIGFTIATVNVVVTPFDFALSSSGTTLDIPHTGYAEVVLTVSPLGGYNQSVHFACSNVPANALCSFDRDWTAPLSGGPQKVKLIVNADVLLEYGPQGTSARLELWKTGGPMLAIAALCFGLRRRRLPSLIAMALCCLYVLQGCSGKDPAATSAGQYTITVTAQDANTLAHSLPLSIHVH